MTALAPLEARRPVERPDFESELVDPAGLVVVERPLPWYERIVKNEAVQNGAILAGLALLWELYARFLDNPLLLPTFSEMVATFLRDISNGLLLNRITTSLKSLAYGYSAGLALAAIFTSVAVSTRLGSGLLTTLTAMFNPLPAIALLPLALIWFGLGTPSLVFVIIHSVLWAVSLNTLVGFRSVPETLRMSGRNLGLARHPLRRAPPHSGGLRGDPCRHEDRLGLRLADADRGGARVRGLVALRRARLVHLRGALRARDREGVRRAVRGDPDRPLRRVGDLQVHRAAHRPALGHAAVSRAAGA